MAPRPGVKKPAGSFPHGATRIEPRTLPEGFTLLQITPRLEGGGVEEVTIEVAAAVARAGGRSLVASRGGKLEAALASHGGELIRLPMHARDPVSIALNAARLARLIRKERVSLLHVRSRAPAFSAWAAARAERIPMIATYHGLYRGGSPLKRWYNSIMTRGDLVLASYRFVAAHIAAEHDVPAERLVIAPEGVDSGLFDPLAVSPARVAAVRQAWGLEEGDERQVLFLPARMTRRKGHALAIEALSGQAGENLILVFAGTGGSSGYMSGLRERVLRASLVEKVRFAGPCDDMPAAYLAADLVLAPSIEPETFGRTVAEAGAMARPVLAAAHGGPAEIVEHQLTGWLVPPADRAEWSLAVAAALATDEPSRRAMGAAARRRVERLYSLPAMFDATFAAYRRVSGNRA